MVCPHCLKSVVGVVDVSIPPGKKVEHMGIKIELVGQTGMSS